MFLFDFLGSIERLEHQFERELAELKRLFPHHHYKRKHSNRPIQVLTTFINNQKFIIMDPLKLQNGQQAPINEALVDANTLKPIPGATKVNKSRSTDNSATAAVDADGNLIARAPGTGNLTTVNTWTYTDQNTNQQVTTDETTVMPYEIAVTAEGVLQVVSLGDAVAIPVVG